MRTPQTSLEWAFVGVTIGQAVLITALQIYVLVSYLHWVNPVVYQVPVSYVFPVAFAVSVLSSCFQVVLAFDSCRVKNKVQIWAQCLMSICYSIMEGMHYPQAKDACKRISKGHDMYGTDFAKKEIPFWRQIGPVLIGIIFLSSISSLSMIVLGSRLHLEFSWSLYEHISPDVKMKARHLRYQAYLVFLKLSLLFIILFVIVYGFVDVHYVEPEFGLTMTIIPSLIIHAFLADFCAKREYKAGMIFVVVIHLGVITYLISRLSVLYGNSLMAKTLMKQDMVFSASIGIAMSALSAVAAVICVFHFGKGLKPLLLGQEPRKSATYQHEMDNTMYLNGAVTSPERVSSRFNID